jgi:hypothetical protein
MYAIGEILLVVLGILIALYINNKKDVYDRQEKQTNHLTLIKEELEKNLAIINKEDDTLLEIIKNIRDFINLANSTDSKKGISETTISELLFLPITRAIEVDYENGAFSEFISSSSLKDIKNDSLRNLLRSWNRKLETLKLQENVIRKSLSKSNNFIEINGSLKTIFDHIDVSESYFEVKNSFVNSSNKNLLKSEQFENILMQYLGVTTQLHQKTYPMFRDDILILINLIKGDLKIN